MCRQHIRYIELTACTLFLWHCCCYCYYYCWRSSEIYRRAVPNLMGWYTRPSGRIDSVQTIYCAFARNDWARTSAYYARLCIKRPYDLPEILWGLRSPLSDIILNWRLAVDLTAPRSSSSSSNTRFQTAYNEWIVRTERFTRECEELIASVDLRPDSITVGSSRIRSTTSQRLDK